MHNACRLSRTYNLGSSNFARRYFRSGLSSFNSTGFPHSDSFGSRLFSSSPKLIAALHVLRRLSMPRHPPLALCSFTYLWSAFTSYFRFHWWLRLSFLQQPFAPVEFSFENSYVAIVVLTLLVTLSCDDSGSHRLPLLIYAYNLMQFSMYNQCIHIGSKIVQELLSIQPPLYSKGFEVFSKII